MGTRGDGSVRLGWNGTSQKYSNWGPFRGPFKGFDTKLFYAQALSNIDHCFSAQCHLQFTTTCSLWCDVITPKSRPKRASHTAFCLRFLFTRFVYAFLTKWLARQLWQSSRSRSSVCCVWNVGRSRGRHPMRRPNRQKLSKSAKFY